MTSNLFDEAAAKSYPEGPARQVPGYSDLHRMVSQLLAERTAPDGNILVLGAGGGQELKALADAHPGWSFEGVDPSAEMLRLARMVTEPHLARIRLVQGYIGDASQGPFDAATSILTFHFIPRDQRIRTLAAIRSRLKVGAPFVLVHLSFPQTEPERTKWIARHVAYGASKGAALPPQENARQAIANRLTILSPEDDANMLAEAGFSGIELFYAGLSIKGWVCLAA